MISKAVRKMLAVSMAMIMAVGAAGCGGGGEETPDPTKAPDSGTDNTPAPTQPVEEDLGIYEVIKDANGNPIDLGGVEIVIRDWWSSGERAEAQNAFDEARYEWYDWIESTYNFTIKELAFGDWTSNPTDFVDYATTGGDEYYLFTLRQGPEVVAAVNNDLMFDLATLDCLDFSEQKWAYSQAHVLMAKGSSIYGMRAIDPEPRGCLYFNKRLLEEAGINPDDLYKWQADGTWTWEKFEEVVAKVHRDTNADGSIDVYGMVQQGSDFHKAAVIGNGGSFIDKTADGMFFNDLESPETIEALTWTVRMREQYEMPQPEGSEWNYFFAEFINGKAAFMTGQVYMAGQDLKDMVDPIGIVAFPKGPSADNYVGYYEDNIYVIPACYDEEKAWKIAFAYNLYTMPLPGFEDNDNWKSQYYQNFDDTQSVDETLQILVDTGIVLHHSMVPGIDLGADILWNLGYADSEGIVYTPAQKAESLREAWQAHIDEANK